MKTNYSLSSEKPREKGMKSLLKLLQLTRGEEKYLLIALLGILINSALTLATPFIIGRAIDGVLKDHNTNELSSYALLLLGLYIGAFIANYIQVKTMGTVGQRLLYNLRNRVFNKLQELPVAFFNQNKIGDLISRINNDTDRLNQFFSQFLMQFLGNAVMIIGTAIALLTLHLPLGLATLTPAFILIIITQLLSGWVKKQNAVSLKAVGDMSAEIQESLNNFKVIVAFNRRDYFRDKFNRVNRENFSSAVKAGLANMIFAPLYGLSTQVAQIIVLFLGIYLISQGQITVGLLVSILTYVNRFYDPLKQMAALWSNFQLTLASWDRILDILSLQNNLPVTTKSRKLKTSSLLTFKNVSFHYDDNKNVLSDINISLRKGKTYALVGPTGGGKTTTASLMARLYDPTEGTIYLNGRDIRSYSTEEKSKKIGFILQEPMLFTGTLRDNITYGNISLESKTDEEILEILETHKLTKLFTRFEKGLSTIISTGESMSLGQRQLIAFIRALLREPELLILDEATANIDTVTEELLQEILEKLPKTTTKVVIAHRLNTIENADEIFFVNAGSVTKAGSLSHAIDLLMKGTRAS